jgi:predicted ATPase/DNA-binding CsgD family transcriptional regulator
VRVLSPEGIRAGLDDRFRLLTGGAKHGLARQQTLAASVEWSYDLLGEAERTTLQRLSVFAGGFTLDAAEAVCAGGGIEPLQILDLVTSLVDKSLVVADDDRARTRYRLLETIRQFALVRLEASGEAEAVREAHAALQLQLAAEAERRFMSDDELAAQEEAEHDNLRAALDWTLARGRLADAVQLLVGLASVWLSRGLLREALVWFDRVLGHPEFAGSGLEYRARWARAVLALIDGRPDPALEQTADVVDRARALGDDVYVARGLAMQGFVLLMADPTAGEKLLLDAVSVADGVEDAISAQLSRAMLVVGGIHREDHRRAALYGDEARPLFESASAHMRSNFHSLVGFSAVRAGRFDEARRHGELARRLAGEAGDPTFAGALADLTMALLEVEQGRIDTAAAVLEPLLRERRVSEPTREDPMLTGLWARVLAARGDLDGAQSVMDDAVRLAGQVGDGLQSGFCLAWQAALVRFRGDHHRARAVAGELREHARQQGHPGFEAMALRELSRLARDDGQLDEADDLAHHALRLAAAAAILPDVVQCLVAVAGIATAEESSEESVRLFAAAEAFSRRMGFVLPCWDRPAADADLALARGALDPDAFAAAWAEGEALDADQAVAYAQRGRGERKRPSSGWASLTPMERQVVDLLADGFRNTEIAARLFVAPSTVKTHLAHVFAKLGVSTRAELAALATRRRSG